MATALMLGMMMSGCLNDRPGDDAPLIPFTVAGTYPHDSTLFTEGLFFSNGRLFESSGAPDHLPFARSVIGFTDLSSGTFTVVAELDKSRHFGEGIAILNNKLYQLTYANRLGFVYDVATCTRLDSFHYASEEGWGLTIDGRHLIMSDGTHQLHFLDPENMTVLKTLTVTDGGVPRDSLNELEYINGFIYANIWMNNTIVKIDPRSGTVVGRIDLSALAEETGNRNQDADVLNGIAYDAATNRVFVTGKLWPLIYAITLPL